MATSEDITEFTKRASKYEVLSKPEEKELIKLAQQGNLKAWDRLIKHNIKLVISIAKKYTQQGLSFEDLIQEGMVGLVTAIQKFDLNKTHEGKPLALSTYATWWIRQHITRAIANTSRLIRVPIHRLNEYSLITRVYREFVERWGKRPNSEELEILIKKAAERDVKGRIKELSKEEIEMLGRMLHPLVYLDQINSEDENLTMLDYISAEEEGQPEVSIEFKADKEYLFKLLKYLNDEDRTFILMKFGMIDGKERKVMPKMSESEVNRKTEEILTKLRKIANKDKVNGLS
jgi:RNA polymerase primary sigma factor